MGTVAQVGITIFGLTGCFLSQCSDIRLRKWSCILGLCGQPFWLYASATSEQYGMFMVCCLYTLVYANGFKNNWMDQ